MPECGESIFAGILRVVEELDIIFINQIVEFFLQIADYDGDIIDAGFMELLNLALNHALAEYLEKSLRSLVGERDKAGAEACGNNDSIVDAVVL